MPETVMVPVRDGIPLATDVHLLDGAGPFPVIMQRSGGSKDATRRTESPDIRDGRRLPLSLPLAVTRGFRSLTQNRSSGAA